MAFGAAVHRVDDANANLAEQGAISAMRAYLQRQRRRTQGLSVIRGILLELTLRGRRIHQASPG